jgi:hypothetical protein
MWKCCPRQERHPRVRGSKRRWSQLASSRLARSNTMSLKLWLTLSFYDFQLPPRREPSPTRSTDLPAALNLRRRGVLDALRQHGRSRFPSFHFGSRLGPDAFLFQIRSFRSNRPRCLLLLDLTLAGVEGLEPPTPGFGVNGRDPTSPNFLAHDHPAILLISLAFA